MNIDFNSITSCGGSCIDCIHYINNECNGCRANGGTCVKMWDSSCVLCKCCKEHNVLFCGICSEFPCDLLEKTLTWDKNGIEKLTEYAEKNFQRDTAFNVFLSSLWKKIGTQNIMVLSTCAEDRVTSRAMSVVVINGKFYCQTDERYLKCRQIKVNHNVSLCVNNFSIEGKCRIIGKPSENNFFIDKMNECFPDAVSRWSDLPTECVLEIDPILITSWIYENNIPYIEKWDFKNKIYAKEKQIE